MFYPYEFRQSGISQLRGSGFLPTRSISSLRGAPRTQTEPPPQRRLSPDDCCFLGTPMARTKVRFTKLTRPRLYNAMAQDRLFGKLDAVRGAHSAICVVGPRGVRKTTLIASWLDARGTSPASGTKFDGGDADRATFIRRLLRRWCFTNRSPRPCRRSHLGGCCLRLAAQHHCDEAHPGPK